MDKLLEMISVAKEPDPIETESRVLTFYSLIFTFWARKMLSLKPSFRGLTFSEIKRFFDLLRKGEKTPPYTMEGFEEIFIGCFKEYISHQDVELQKISFDALSQVWKSFKDEYAWVPCDNMDARFVRFLIVNPA